MLPPRWKVSRRIGFLRGAMASHEKSSREPVCSFRWVEVSTWQTAAGSIGGVNARRREKERYTTNVEVAVGKRGAEVGRSFVSCPFFARGLGWGRCSLKKEFRDGGDCWKTAWKPIPAASTNQTGEDAAGASCRLAPRLVYSGGQKPATTKQKEASVEGREKKGWTQLLRSSISSEGLCARLCAAQPSRYYCYTSWKHPSRSR